MDLQECQQSKEAKGFVAAAAEKICGGIKNAIDVCVAGYKEYIGTRRAKTFCEGVSKAVSEGVGISENKSLDYLRELTNADEIKKEGFPWWGIMIICLGSAAVVGTGIACCAKKCSDDNHNNYQRPEEIVVANGGRWK